MRSILVTLLLFHVCQSCFLPSLFQIVNFLTGKLSFKNILDSRDTTFTTGELITKAGFKPEVYSVVTDDGYILSLIRIRTFTNPGPPVLLIPGATECSDAYVLNDDGLAFTLAKSGFDCWIANLRGSVFSRYHKYINPDKPPFWNFSFHETGTLDIPAFMFKVLANTKYHKMFYIGHSMGTTLFTIMASARLELNQYIQTAVLLSPTIFPPKYIRSNVMKVVLANIDFIKGVLNAVHKYELFPRSYAIEYMLRLFCRFPLKMICTYIMHDLTGGNLTSINTERYTDEYIISSFFGGTSSKTIIHYLQLFKTDEFKQYDYGKDKNYQVYNHTQPPHYPLNRISAPVVIFYSEADHLTDGRSALKLASLLPNVLHVEDLPDFSHSDFLFGKTAPQLLFTQIVDRFIEESKVIT